MKRTVIVSAVALAFLGFGASPALADATPTTTEAATSIPEGPSVGARGAGASPAPIPDQLSGPSSNGAAEALLPPDSTEPTDLRPDHGSTGRGSSNTGSSNTGSSHNGSSAGGKPGAGAGDSTDPSGAGHTPDSTTRASTNKTSSTVRTATERGTTSASAGRDSTAAPNSGPSAGETNTSAGANGSAASENANDANSTDTNNADTTADSDGTDSTSTADSDGTDSTSTADSADTDKDGSAETAADSDAPAQIDASVTVSPDEITESDLYFEGITVTVSGLKTGDQVTNSLDDEVTVAQSSTVEFMYLPEDFVEPGVVTVTVTVAREGVANQVIQSEFTVVSDTDAVEGTLTMSATRMSVSDFADKGIDFTAEPFGQGGPILGFAFSDDSEEALYFDGDLKADSSGRVSGTVTANDVAEPTPGDYHLFVISDDAEAWTDFTLTEDFAPTEPTNSGTETTGSKDTALPHTQNESTSRERTSAHWSRAGSAWSDSEEAASESASLPRTGAELGSLGLGGALLIAGIAMVAITAHRRSGSQ